MRRTNRQQRNGTRTGFTLAEMLIVIAIIMVLAAIIFPVYLNAREMGYAARCVSNLHQLQIALENYTAGSQRYPPAYSTDWTDVDGKHWHDKGWVAWASCTTQGTTVAVTPVPSGLPYSWRRGDTVAPYAVAYGNITNGVLWYYAGREPKVYFCPTFAQKRNNGGYTDVMRSYSMNTNLHQQLGRNVFDVAIKPSQWIAFMDEAMGSTANKKDPVCFTNEMSKIHRFGRGHAVYLDGHVEKMQ